MCIHFSEANQFKSIINEMFFPTLEQPVSILFTFIISKSIKIF